MPAATSNPTGFRRLASALLRGLGLGLLGAAAALSAQTTFTWTGGDILPVLNPPTVVSGDTLDVTTSADHTFNGSNLLNQGTINWQGGYLRAGFNVALTNDTGATFNDTASSHLDNPYGYTLVFTNNGTYNKTAAGTTNFDTFFDNNGQLNVQAGAISFNGGGTNSGTGVITASSGATVTFANSYTLADGSTWDPLESTCRHASLSIL